MICDIFVQSVVQPPKIHSKYLLSVVTVNNTTFIVYKRCLAYDIMHLHTILEHYILFSADPAPATMFGPGHSKI